MDIRQSLNYARYLRKIGWVVVRKDKTNYFIRKVFFLGSIIKIQRPEKVSCQYINRLTAKHRAFQIIIEPKNERQGTQIKNCGLRLSKSPYLPTKTLMLNLTQTKEGLFNQMKKDARSALKKTQKLQLKIFDLEEISEFRRAWKEAVGLKRFVPSTKQLISLKETFGEDCLVITDTKRVSGAIFLFSGKTGYYWQAFSSKKGRKSLAQYKIVWEGIVWAKKKGAKLFDFEGIYDKRFPMKAWKGFTHFKKSFGGKEVQYPGAFVKNLLPLVL